MGKRKALTLTGFSTFILILMVASMPFAQPSRLRLQLSTTLAERTHTKGLEMDQAAGTFGHGGGGAKALVSVEDSARQVPAGPDPLHHNNNPINRP